MRFSSGRLVFFRQKLDGELPLNDGDASRALDRHQA